MNAVSMTPFERLQDYERRSLTHVAGNPLQAGEGAQWRGLAYRIGQRRLVSEHTHVVEILGVPSVTPVPGAQSWLLGLANVRGNLLPVVDLRQFLEGQRSVQHERQRMLVIRQPGGDVGVLVDELYGQRGFDAEQQVQAADLAEGRYATLVEQVYCQQDERWAVFNLGRLARIPEFRQAAA
ncbi:chemotaxis protein CheW [Lysobacteraceae bacterium NML75-0749]|nr:chemotaxis protein CheW [Xanthomonadaceae bacterium NML75-0749]PJK04550.1 chemotaxis protein CheW [Xanthomonadaceae bacterium NML91-0268]